MNLVALLLVGAIALGLAGCSQQVPQEITVNTGEETSGINVTGSSKITVVPDIALLDCGVSTLGATPDEAQTQTSNKMNTIIAKLKELGIEDKDMQTANVYLREDFDYTDNGKKSNGYMSEMSLSIKVRDISKAGQVMKAVTEAGADEIGGLEYDLSERDAKYSEALALALTNAREKANNILKAEGKESGNIISLVEQQANYYAPMQKNVNMAYDAVAGEGSAEIMQGEAEVTAKINVTFEIKQ